MSLSLFVLCLTVSALIFLADASMRVAKVTTTPARFSIHSNMRRVTSVPVLVDDDAEDSLDDVLYFDEAEAVRRGKKNTKMWDHWGKWTPCSVSCGVGKMVRWRHCVSDGCAPGEKEAQIKTCTKPACQ